MTWRYGRIVRRKCLEPLQLSVTDGARALAVFPEMAIRLAKAFGGSAKTWPGLQLADDLAQIMNVADKVKVQRVPLSA